MRIEIKLKSKNKFSLQKFYQRFTKFNHVKFALKRKFKKTKRSFISVLRSPHVNKKAQDQYEIIVNQFSICLIPFNRLKTLLFLKNFVNKNFSEIIYKINFKIFNVNKIQIIFDRIKKLNYLRILETKGCVIKTHLLTQI